MATNGGEGCEAWVWITVVPASETVTVGNGGAGGVIGLGQGINEYAAGQNGGNSSFGSYVTVEGGKARGANIFLPIPPLGGRTVSGSATVVKRIPGDNNGGTGGGYNDDGAALDINALANTGGGGAGASQITGGSGGNGGSGYVIIYEYT